MCQPARDLMHGLPAAGGHRSGGGTGLIVFAPTLAGWVPGAVAALPVNVLAKNPNAKW